MVLDRATEAERIAIIRALYAAINRGDIAGALRDFAEDARFVELPGRAYGRDCDSRAALFDYLTSTRANWLEGGCEPVRFLSAGDRLVVFVHVHVRVKGRADWAEGDVGDVFTFRGRKVIASHSYDDPRQALAFAGVAE
jgi:ketosteroid isomerase-like protein